MRVKSILTILDKPQHEQLALARAAELAERLAVPLNLAAFCWQPLAGSGTAFTARERAAIRRELLEQRRRWQRELAVAAGVERLKPRHATVWTDDIAAWVAREVKRGAGTLLVKSVHKSQTLLHTPLDWRLLRESRAPIYLVQPRRRRKVRNILAALDLRHVDAVHQRLNRKVLDAAVTFARSFGADVHCVYAVEVSEVLRDLDIVDERRAVAKAREASGPALQALLAPYGLSVDAVHFPAGKIGRAVRSVAQQVRADLLVVGTLARRSKLGFGLGNSAERLLTKAVCDVLAVHP